MHTLKTKFVSQQGFALLILILAVAIIAIIMVWQWRSALVPQSNDESTAIQQAQEAQEQNNSRVEATKEALDLINQ